MTVLDRFFELERKLYGRADYHYKPDKLSSKIRAFYSRPFAPTYMENFTTTMYPDTFFPEKKRGNPESAVQTEYHENVHKFDRWKEGIKFTFKYIWPHWLGVPFLLAAVGLGGLWSWLALGALLTLLHAGLGVLAISAAGRPEKVPSRAATIAFYVLVAPAGLALLAATIMGGGWFAFLWVGAALFLSPWPIKPTGRRDAELRGYTATLYRVYLRYGELWDSIYTQLTDTFAGSSYFFMERDKAYIEREFRFQVRRFMDGLAQEKKGVPNSFHIYWAWERKRGWSDSEMGEPFKMIYDFMKDEGLLHASVR